MPSNREWLNGLAANDPQKLNVWFEAEHMDDNDEISKLKAEHDKWKAKAEEAERAMNAAAGKWAKADEENRELRKMLLFDDGTVEEYTERADPMTALTYQKQLAEEWRDRCHNAEAWCDKLESERDELTNAINELQKKQPYCYDPEAPLDTLRTVGRYIDELQAERDELQKELDIANAKLAGKPECEICDRATLLVEIEKLRDERDEWKAKVKTLADYSKYWRGRCAKLEYRNDKRAAAVERLRKKQHVDDYGDWVEAIAEVVKGTDRSNIGDYGMWESLIDLLSDENVGIPYERPRIIDPSEIEAMVANANSKAGPPQPATSIDAQQDTNGTCPDGDETCPNHSKAHSKTEPSLSQLFGILSDDYGQIADMSQKSADCVRSELEMPEIDEPDTIRNELEDNGYVVMPYHNGEKQAKLRGKEYDQMIFDELHDSRENLGSEPSTLEDFEGKGSEVDSRKKLEADAQSTANAIYLMAYDDGVAQSGRDAEPVRVGTQWITELLDRQAAITAKRLCSECTPTVAEERDYLRTRVDELNTQVAEQSELIAARGKTIEALEKFMSERKYKLKKQLESKTEQCRKLKAERDEYRELYEAAMSTDYGQLSKEHEQFREEISEMLGAAQQIERIRAKHETQLN